MSTEREDFEAWYAKRHGDNYMRGGNATWANAAKADDFEVWQAARATLPSTSTDGAQAGKSLNAKAADLLRPFLKPGDKVIWRDSFRWKDDEGVLSNHYDSMELESLAADFGYDVDWDTNFKHAAIVRMVAAASSKEHP